jgi:hypothetical protein
MNKHLATVMMVLMIAAGAASADLLAYEGFNVSVGDLDGQATGPSGSYFAGTEAWSVSGDSTVDGWEGQTGGLSYGTLITNGGSARGWRGNGSTYNDSGGADAVLAASSPTTNTDHTELYFSALINGDSILAANSIVVGWDHETATGNDRIHGFEIRGAGDIWSYGGTGTDDDDDSDTGLALAAGDNLIVIRVTDKTAGGNTDEYDLWLNPDLSNPGAADYSAPDGFNAGLVVNNGDFGFDGFFMNETFDNSGTGSNGVEQSVLVDELRIGETFADVTPIPEPATMALLGIGGLGVLLKRKR